MNKSKDKTKDAVSQDNESIAISSNELDVELESSKRDAKYSEFLSCIIEQAKRDSDMKSKFFHTVLIIFFSVCVASFIVVFVVLNSQSKSNLDFAACVGAFGSIIGSIVTLPHIIANHLFPQNGEEVRLNFMKDIKQFDASVQNTALLKDDHDSE